ncbi:hypothetical protein QEV83_13800 [Methylocapsa sp. D3K7]|uniref:hypothetical protein n=1 Tax=Methylocapsa sp. D3K7 TaxID=3041435 RepID=UPI00244EFB1B|nr:hypothetical protein [Methylocapsa sp. D3K7]WGJ13749.1 hypothetical protein QEV83_13800 [Methylocapsa sp. D3K7]
MMPAGSSTNGEASPSNFNGHPPIYSTCPAMAGRAALGAGAGAVQGGLYGAGSSEDLTNLPDVAKNTATGVALGGTIGAAAPAALSGIGRVARGVDSIVRGVATPDRRLAASRVADALARDAGKSQFDEAAMRTAQDAGQPMIVADMGGQVTQDLARSAANTSPEARAALHSATDPRFESQAPRIAEFVSDLGGGSNATATLEKLQAAAKAANRPAYTKAFAEGANGIWNDQLAGLMQTPAVQDAVRGAIKTGANRDVAEGFRPVKSPFDLGADGTIVPRVNSDGSRAIPSLQFWDGVKRNLDDTVGRLMRSGEKSAAADAIALRSQLVDALDAASPSYAKARGTAAQFFGAQDAVGAGAKFVTDQRPNAEVARAIAKMSPPEKQLFAHGFASALADKIEKVSDRRSVLNSIFNSPATRQRVTMALGPDKASKLEAYLNTEAAMDAVRKALGNSTTARQLASLGMAGGLGGLSGTVDYLHGGSFTTGALAGMALGHLARQGTLKIDQRIAHSVGRMLASSNPADYKTVLALAAKSKRGADVIHAVTPRGVAAVLPAALDELRQKRAAQGRQTPSGVMPDEVARASLGLR